MDKINTGSTKTTLLSIAALIIIIAAVMYAESFINPLLMALFIIIICDQPITWLKKKKLPGGLAITIVILGILAIYVGFFELIRTSLSLFVENSPKYEQNISELRNSIIQFLNARGIKGSILGSSGSMDPSKIMQYTAKIFGQLGDIMSREITFIFLTIFLLAEIDSVSLKMKLVAKNTKLSFNYLNSAKKGIQHYLSIKTTVSLITGVLVSVSLSIIGVDYPVLWGIVAFLLNYIPNIGSIIAAIPAVLLSIIQLGFPASLWTITVYIVINIVIGNIVEPKIMGKGMGLSTFIVFFALIFWGFILGPVGMFLSVPLTIAIKIMFEQNPETKWIAAMLGTKDELQLTLKEK